MTPDRRSRHFEIHAVGHDALLAGRSAAPEADQVASWIAEGAIAHPVRLIHRLLDDFGITGLEPLECAVNIGGGQVDAGIGSLGHHLGDEAALVVGDAGGGGRRIQDDRRVGLLAGTDRDPVHPAVFDVVADLEAERVAIEGQGCLRVVVRKHARVNCDVHAATLGVSQRPRFSIPDRFRPSFGLVRCTSRVSRSVRQVSRRRYVTCPMPGAGLRRSLAIAVKNDRGSRE